MTKFKVGDKVVPHSKSIWGNLESSAAWRNAKEECQPFLYVNNIHIGHPTDGDYACGYTRQSGDFFNESDLEFYSDQNGIKPGDIILVATSDAPSTWFRRIFISKVNDLYVCVADGNESDFTAKRPFDTCCWKYGESLPKFPTSYEIKLNDSYIALVTKDKIKVGCQEFSIKVLKELNEAVSKLNSI